MHQFCSHPALNLTLRIQPPGNFHLEMKPVGRAHVAQRSSHFEGCKILHALSFLILIHAYQKAAWNSRNCIDHGACTQTPSESADKENSLVP